MNNIVKSNLARVAIAEGRKKHLRFRVHGYGEVPTEDSYENEWWTEILKSDSIIPPEGLPAIKVLKDAKIPIQGMYLQHEAPKLLPAPKQKKEVETEFPTETVIGTVLGVLAVVGTVLAFLLVMALRIDPKLIVVLEDGTHLEVATWFDFTSP